MKRLLTGLILTVMAAVAITPAAVAGADPIEPYCFDARLCSDDFGSRTYCPDSGSWVGPFGTCASLNTGPYAPGGLRPNQSIWDDEDPE